MNIGNRPATKNLGKYKKALVLRQHAERKKNEWKKHFFAMRDMRDSWKSVALKYGIRTPEELDRVLGEVK